MDEIRKYPRTPHLEGSRLQPGDEDLSQIRFSEIRGKHLVVEEKCDGANSGISFGRDGELLLQSRGHYLTGGYRERHYNLMKQWAAVHKETFYRVLGKRYIMYGEWMYAKHTVFYDALPHYFLEFDIFDKEKGIYLDTPSRQKLTGRMPIVSVPILAEGIFHTDIVPYRPCILAYRIYMISPHQKCRFPYLYFRFACLSKIIRPLLLFRYPMKLATLKCGSISPIISWQHFASMILTPFRSLNPLSIFLHPS